MQDVIHHSEDVHLFGGDLVLPRGINASCLKATRLLPSWGVPLGSPAISDDTPHSNDEPPPFAGDVTFESRTASRIPPNGMRAAFVRNADIGVNFGVSTSAPTGVAPDSGIGVSFGVSTSAPTGVVPNSDLGIDGDVEMSGNGLEGVPGLHTPDIQIFDKPTEEEARHLMFGGYIPNRVFTMDLKHQCSLSH